MALIKKKTFSFDMPTTASLADVNNFLIYYAKGATVDTNSPSVSIPVVAGQLTYSVILPDKIPVTDGQYQIGVASVDAAGNQSDLAVLDYFFDFVAPVAPIRLRVT